MLFNSEFANNTFLSCFFNIFIDLYFLISTAISQIFYPIVELVIAIGVPSKEPKTEIEIHPVIAESKIKKCSI